MEDKTPDDKPLMKRAGADSDSLAPERNSQL